MMYLSKRYAALREAEHDVLDDEAVQLVDVVAVLEQPVDRRANGVAGECFGRHDLQAIHQPRRAAIPTTATPMLT